jgi:Ca-activated chloride channel homolog
LKSLNTSEQSGTRENSASTKTLKPGKKEEIMKKLTLVVIGVLIAILGVTVALYQRGSGETVEVIQWGNGHVMWPQLLPGMAKQFNDAGYKTKSGKTIVVQVVNVGSAEQSDDLISRINSGRPANSALSDPTIVTPSSADWLVRANFETNREVVDISGSRTIAKSYIGIVTYEDMARALGWPEKEIGYGDIIALRKNPQGWASVPGAKAEWGQEPLFAFTDPITSTTGRSLLFGLYGIGASKTSEQLTSSDVTDAGVTDYIKDFQNLIDHYMIGTIPLNTKVAQGPLYGHFFVMPEDNLISLYDGGMDAYVSGQTVKMKPIRDAMVMIYPKEGSMVRNNIAGIVKAPWVTPEKVEGALKWIEYILREEQQKVFLQAGFRPAIDLPLDDPGSKITSHYGLTAEPKAPLLIPEKIDPAVAAAIENSWQDVKKPGIVTFVVDVSGSMDGQKMDQTKDGIIRALDNMAQNNQVGFLTFSNNVSNLIPVGPLASNRYSIANAVKKMRAQSETALYDGIKSGIEMTDQALGEANAIRAVVVLTDGQANTGTTQLDSLVKMISRNEVAIRQFGGLKDESGIDQNGQSVSRHEIIGQGLSIETHHPVQIFFIGIGADADMEVGRIISQATGAEFQGVAEKDLANLLEQFSKYF